jgi:hypothetical protein
MDPSLWVIPEENKISYQQEFAALIETSGTGLLLCMFRFGWSEIRYPDYTGEFLVNLLEQSGTIDRKSASEIVYYSLIILTA